MIQTMQSVKQLTKRFITTGVAVLFVVSTSTPMLALADASTCNPVTPTPGIQQPTGPDAVTYTFDSCSGLWVNQYYTWSPATKQATPITPLVYTCDATTSPSQWDSSKWVYDNTRGTWSQKAFNVDTPPNDGSVIVPCLPPPSSSSDSSDSDSSSNSGTVNDSTNSGVTNTLGSTAASGDASVNNNYIGGSAASGDAQAIANVINMLQSSSGLGSTAATFTANINGDVQGDLVIDPSYLQPASASLDASNNLDVNVDNNGVITNNIDLDASTGDATVNNNYSAGNASSGNAEAVANVVNMLNSLISAQQSFVGVININGNFNGNILMPQSFLDSLIASNAPQENVAISNSTLDSINANLNNNTNISNNVNSTAQSGTANVNNNTTGGSATSGNAKTNVTIFNLANEQISGANTLLVFVNVLGRWVGVLMDAPGSTAAAYGGNVTASATNTANVNATNNGTITNNINANATSGDASVTNNFNAGNAKSGNAETAVNLSNITNSSINLSGWFGILFINVFGNWYGSFGVASPAAATGSAASGGAAPQTFNFLPKKTVSSAIGGDHGSSTVNAQLADVAAKVLGTSTSARGASAQKMDNAVKHDTNQAVFVGGALLFTGVILMVVEGVRARK